MDFNPKNVTISLILQHTILNAIAIRVNQSQYVCFFIQSMYLGEPRLLMPGMLPSDVGV